MFARCAAASPITIARYLNALRKEIERLPRCVSLDCILAYFWGISRQASLFIGLVRLCFVLSEKSSRSYGFLVTSPVLTMSSKIIKWPNEERRKIALSGGRQGCWLVNER